MDAVDRLLMAEWLRLLAQQPITPQRNPWFCDDEELDGSARPVSQESDE